MTGGFSFTTVLPISVSIDILISSFYFGLYRAGRSERISRIYICLSIAYACLAASQLCILLRIYGFAFLALPEDFFYISWIFILWQGVRFFGSTNRFNPLSLTVPALLALWAVMSHVLAIPLPWSSIPLRFTASGIFLLSCLYLWRNYRENRNIGLAIGAFMFLLCSLNTAGYPFLRNIAWYNPYGFTIAMILSLAIGMGLMLAILHEERLKLVKEMDVRRRAEEALSLKTALLEAQMEASIDGIIVLDEKRNPLIMNRRLVEIGGVPEQVLALEDNNAVYDHLSGIVEDPETVMGIFSHLDEHPWEIYRDELKFKDGRVLDRYTAPVTGTEGQLYGRLWILRDITGQRVAEEERKKIESRLNQSEKMEAIGNLAGGIAHDFNNILGVIMGYCSILRNRMAEGDPGISYVNNIMSASEKAVDLVKSLLAFGRKQNIEIKHCRINEIVRGVEKLLVRLLPEDINLSVELDESEPVIMADISQIDRVFLNLATNSRDAMPAGGSFVIRTGTVLLDREFMDTWGYGEPGRYVLVSVSDTGKGFDEVTGKKIFDPFFTTKEEGKGTGMGLSNVYGIIRQHKGFINVYSEPDRGTVFRIYLPAVEEGEAEGEAERTADSLRGGTETILVGEDYDDLREIMKTLLESAGYTVIEAVDGNDAVRKFMENRDSINLLVLDVVMPGKNGRDAYDEISRIRPGIRVLFSSGYTGDVVISRGVRTESIDFVSKPLSPNELLIKVREMLDK